MRIAILTSSFPRYKGDHIGVFIYDLARSLVDEGLDVHVLAPHDTGYPRQDQWEGVTIHRFRYVPAGFKPVLFYGPGAPDNLKHKRTAWFQVPLYSFSLFLAIWRLVRRERIQVVNSHWLLMQGVSAALLRSWAGVPHICTVHAGEISLLSRLPFRRQLAAFTLQHSDRLICVSRRSQQRLEEITQMPVEATVMPMGINVARFQSRSLSREVARRAIGAQAAETLLFVGRLTEKKGIGYLLQALPALRRDFADLELLVVGTGHLESSLKAQARQLGLDKVTRFIGHVPNDDLPTYYRAADVVVIPSIVSETGDEEGMPVVLLEALATGCRVVATRTGGIPEIIRDGENGFLANSADVDSLTTAILRALSDTGGGNVQQAAYETARAFDWSKIAEAYSAMARELVEQAVR